MRCLVSQQHTTDTSDQDEVFIQDLNSLFYKQGHTGMLFVFFFVYFLQMILFDDRPLITIC